MAAAVRAMVGKSLGALIFKNVEMALQVLESDDAVDQYRDRIFENVAARHDAGAGNGRVPDCNMCWRPGIWSASPTTPRTFLKILFSGCAAWMCDTGVAAGKRGPRGGRRGHHRLPCHRKFIRPSSGFCG